MASVQSGGSSGGRERAARDQQPASTGMADLFDLSLLKFSERDALVEALQKCRQKVSGAAGLWARVCGAY